MSILGLLPATVVLPLLLFVCRSRPPYTGVAIGLATIQLSVIALEAQLRRIERACFGTPFGTGRHLPGLPTQIGSASNTPLRYGRFVCARDRVRRRPMLQACGP